MKKFDLLIFIDENNIKINNVETNLNDLPDKIKDLSFNKIVIIIADSHIYKLEFDLKLKKLSEVKKAAENHFLYLNPDSTYNPKYFNISLKKTENGYHAKVLYLSKEAEEFIDIISTSGYKNKIVNILPLFEVYKNIERKYILKNFITLINSNDNIVTFNIKDLDSFKNFLSEEEIENLKEIDFDILKNLDFKNINFKVDFLQKNKGYEVLNKAFYPIIIGIVLINLILFSYVKYEYLKYKKEYKSLKKINIELNKKVEPVLKTEKILEKYIEVNNNINDYTSQSFPFLKFLRELSKVDNLFINNLYLRNNSIRIYGKTKSALKLLEKLKKLPFLKDPKIISNISRDSNGNERFQIEAKIKYGK